MSWRRLWPAAVFVLLLAAFLRFHLLEAQSFWNDEGNSARLSERSFPAILEGTASDVHPPLYYLLLRGWRELAGETEFGLRSLSAYAGVVTVAVVVALVGQGSRGAGKKGGKEEGEIGNTRGVLNSSLVPQHSSLVVAGLLATVSPVLVYYSQETRMYALLALVAGLSTWVLLVWLGAARSSRVWAMAYLVLVAAGLYIHYFFPAVIAAQGAVVVLWRPDPQLATAQAADRHARNRLLVWFGLATAAAVLYLPWLPIFIRQISGRGGAPVSLVNFAAQSTRWLVLGSTVDPNQAIWAVSAAVALVILGVALGGRRSLPFLLLAAIPLVIMFLVGATDPAFFKFMLVVVPFLLALMGLAWRARWPWSAIPAALTVAVLAGSLVSLGNLYGNPAFARADYRGMAARVAAEGHPNAGIILVAPNQWEAFTYYHRDGAPVYPLPRGRPDPTIVEPELAAIAAAHDRLYALFWGAEQRDPEGVIERWLDNHAFKAFEEWVGDVRFVIYAVTPAGEATPSGAAFEGLDGETITLYEYAVGPIMAQPGDAVAVRLVWSADATPERAYKVFLHLLDGAGNVVAQRDGELGGAARPAISWTAGDQVTGNHGLLLPPDLPPGGYNLRMGLYDALDPNTRLPVNGDDGLMLATVTVR
jgi:hypothetical protein